MSVFGTRFGASLPRMFGQFGTSMLITLNDGSTLTRTGIYNVQQYAIDHTQDATFHFANNATTGLTEAQALRTSTVTYLSSVWSIVDPKEDDDGGWTLTAKAPQLTT